MVDIHSHILAGLDDGAKDFQESLAMLAIAVQHGTTDIVASPHSDLRYSYDQSLVCERIEELQSACRAIRIHRGCDFHLIPERILEALADPSRYSINGKGFLLVEFSNSAIPDATDHLLERMKAAGLTPILTHPERNPILQEDLGRIRFWVDRGCLVQITGQSIVGQFGRTAKRICRELLRSGLVHFVASDGHDVKSRPPILTRAFQSVQSDYGEEAAELLFRENPRKVLTGEAQITTIRPRQRSAWHWLTA